MRRSRFQQGSLQIVKRAGGRKAWEYRWYELQADGSRTRRNLMVGSLEQYPNETAAQKAVAALRADINAENPRTSFDSHQCSNACRTLPGKRAGAGLHQNAEDAGHLRRLFPKVDFAPLGTLSRNRGQSGRGGAVASFAEVCEWKQGQSSKHHERGFQSRSQVGMA